MKDVIVICLIAVVFIMPQDGVQIVDDKIIKDLQAYMEVSDKSYKDAESEILKRVNPDIPDIKDGCNGSGWIIQGDGHRSRCPGCDKCSNGSGPGSQMELIESKPIIEDPVKETAVKETVTRYRCKCDTKSTYCRCVKEFGECKCKLYER